jgi:hypothetical protein
VLMFNRVFMSLRLGENWSPIGSTSGQVYGTTF